MAAKTVTLVYPDGREYRTSNKGEIVNLKAQGCRVKPVPKPPKPRPVAPVEK